jgi:hypothetical protein
MAEGASEDGNGKFLRNADTYPLQAAIFSRVSFVLILLT